MGLLIITIRNVVNLRRVKRGVEKKGLCHRPVREVSQRGCEQGLRREDAPRIAYPAPPRVVRQMVAGDSMKALQPAAQAAVIGINLLCVGSAAHADAGTHLDGLVADARLPVNAHAESDRPATGRCRLFPC